MSANTPRFDRDQQENLNYYIGCPVTGSEPLVEAVQAHGVEPDRAFDGKLVMPLMYRHALHGRNDQTTIAATILAHAGITTAAIPIRHVDTIQGQVLTNSSSHRIGLGLSPETSQRQHDRIKAIRTAMRHVIDREFTTKGISYSLVAIYDTPDPAISTQLIAALRNTRSRLTLQLDAPQVLTVPAK